METTKYLVVGSSHAALEALTAIRMHDTEGSLTMLTRDAHLPYSPTVLPYVVSGRSAPDTVFLRDEKFFARQKISLRRGTALKALHPARNTAELADGSQIAYEKILLATGASPAIPPIPGIDQVSYHVLRTLDDATRLNAAMKASKQAVVMGAGLVGMHAAENLVKAGAKVTIVEMAKQLTDGYFDATAAALIEKEAFRLFFALGGGFETLEADGVTGLAAARQNTDAFVDAVIATLDDATAAAPRETATAGR